MVDLTPYLNSRKKIHKNDAYQENYIFFILAYFQTMNVEIISSKCNSIGKIIRCFISSGACHHAHIHYKIVNPNRSPGIPR